MFVYFHNRAPQQAEMTREDKELEAEGGHSEKAAADASDTVEVPNEQAEVEPAELQDKKGHGAQPRALEGVAGGNGEDATASCSGKVDLQERPDAKGDVAQSPEPAEDAGGNSEDVAMPSPAKVEPEDGKEDVARSREPEGRASGDGEDVEMPSPAKVEPEDGKEDVAPSCEPAGRAGGNGEDAEMPSPAKVELEDGKEDVAPSCEPAGRAGGNAEDVEMPSPAKVKPEEYSDDRGDGTPSRAEEAGGMGEEAERSPKEEVKDEELQDELENGDGAPKGDAPMPSERESGEADVVDGDREFPEIPLSPSAEKPPLVRRQEQWAQKPKAVTRGRPKAKAKGTVRKAIAKAKPGRKPTAKQTATRGKAKGKKAPDVVDLDSDEELPKAPAMKGAAEPSKAKTRKRPAAPAETAGSKAKKDAKDGGGDLIKWAPVTQEGIEHMNLACGWQEGEENGQRSGAVAKPSEKVEEEVLNEAQKLRSFARRPCPKTSPSKQRWLAIRGVFQEVVQPWLEALQLPVSSFEAGTLADEEWKELEAIGTFRLLS